MERTLSEESIYTHPDTYTSDSDNTDSELKKRTLSKESINTNFDIEDIETPSKVESCDQSSEIESSGTPSEVDTSDLEESVSSDPDLSLKTMSNQETAEAREADWSSNDNWENQESSRMTTRQRFASLAASRLEVPYGVQATKPPLTPSGASKVEVPYGVQATGPLLKSDGASKVEVPYGLNVSTKPKVETESEDDDDDSTLKASTTSKPSIIVSPPTSSTRAISEAELMRLANESKQHQVKEVQKSPEGSQGSMMT